MNTEPQVPLDVYAALAAISARRAPFDADQYPHGYALAYLDRHHTQFPGCDSNEVPGSDRADRVNRYVRHTGQDPHLVSVALADAHLAEHHIAATTDERLTALGRHHDHLLVWTLVTDPTGHGFTPAAHWTATATTGHVFVLTRLTGPDLKTDSRYLIKARAPGESAARPVGFADGLRNTKGRACAHALYLTRT